MDAEERIKSSLQEATWRRAQARVERRAHRDPTPDHAGAPPRVAGYRGSRVVSSRGDEGQHGDDSQDASSRWH